MSILWRTTYQSEALEEKWKSILEEKGRVPYITYPLVCAKCGKLWPDLFTVSDKEWKYYIQLDMRDSILCEDCYNYIVTIVDIGTLIKEGRDEVSIL